MWADSQGLVTRPTPDDITRALKTVQVSADNSTQTYGNLTIPVVNDTITTYDSLVKISFLQMVGNSSWTDIEIIITRFFVKQTGSTILLSLLF